jgi:Flp pilus assembly protein TadD
MPIRRILCLSALIGLSLTAPVRAQEPGNGFSGAFLAARHASFTSDYRAAADYYTRALARDRGNPALQESAMLAFVGLGKIDTAMPIARQMRSDGIRNQTANMVFLGSQLKAGEYAEMVAALDDGEIGIGPLVDGLARAWSLVGAGEQEAAMTAFDESAKKSGLAAFGLYHKALALALSGDFAAADEVFAGKAGAPLRLSRRGAISHAQVLSQLDRNPAAIELIRAGWGTDLDPGLEELVTQLEAGEKIPFTQVRNVQDGLAEVFYTVADVLEGEAADSYTLMYTRMAEYLNPDHVDAILLSAGLLEAQGQFDLATEAYNRVPSDDAGFHVAEIGRAAALDSSGQADEALEVLKALAESHSDQILVHVTLGDSLRRADRFEEAVAAYDDAVEMFETDERGQWFVYYARGISLERLEQWDRAEADFRKALDLNPGQPQVLNYLGYSYVEKQTNLDEALSMIVQAVETEPDSGYIVDSLGWVLYRLGRYSESVGHMERAAELMATDPIVNDHLGDVYWAVGRRVEAEFQWHRALSFDPEPEDADRIRRKLEVGLDVVLEEEGADPLTVVNEEG